MASLLIDEMISPAVSRRLCNLGHYATSVRDRGLLNAPDWAIWKYAGKHDMTFVTINATDYIALCKSVPTHSGLIVIPNGGTRDDQFERINFALERGLNICDSNLPPFANCLIRLVEGRVYCDILTRDANRLQPLEEGAKDEGQGAFRF